MTKTNKQIMEKVLWYAEQDYNTFITHGDIDGHIMIIDDNGSLIEEFFLNE